MKTLDEVIKALEICDETVTANCPDCPYDLDCENVPGEDLRADALHYLKAYKDDRDDLTALRAFWAEQQGNDPLTWSELKQMFHKPVWIETKTKSTWCIINDFDDECVNVIHTSHKGAKCSHFAKHLMGDTWQAYRKERHETDN